MLAVPLPNFNRDRSELLLDSQSLDGFILTGGNSLSCVEPDAPDVAFERDKFEKEVISYAIKNNIPILGVCRGAQVINNYFGGELIRVDNHIAIHHDLVSYADSFQLPEAVNSFHAWGIPSRGLGEELDLLATDKDGYVEAFIHKSQSIIGLMWHPERNTEFDPKDINILRRLFL